jgi:carbon monoxide dehydrogenase subunit G
MKLEQSFEVEAPLERVWQTLIDVEHVAPCLPGAAVTGRNDDGSYNGTFTVKIGPTTASYTGRLEMENIDEAAHTATMQAQGTDKRGQGGAKATIHSRLAPADGRGTRVEVVTDYHITGRLARFGRGGMIEDISERLLREFAKRLQSSLAAQQDTIVSPAPEPVASAAEPVASAPEPVAPAGEPEAPVSPGAEAPVSPGAESEEPIRDHTVFASVPSESAPPEASVSPAGGITPPPPPPPSSEPSASTQPWGTPSEPSEAPTAVPEPPAPVAEPVGGVPVGGEPGGAAPEPPAPPPPPSPGPPPVATPPPAPPLGERPPMEHLPQPSEPMQGLSLVGGVMWNRVKRNPAPAAAAGVAVMLLLARRRRRRH